MTEIRDKYESPTGSITDVEKLEIASTKLDSEDEAVVIDTTASEALPRSKARCITLAATLASVPFLSLTSNLSTLTDATGN